MRSRNESTTPEERMDASGDISRRTFLDRTGKLTLAGFGAAALESVASRQAEAQGPQSAGTALAPDRFDYAPVQGRPVLKWPNGARLAFWVAPNIEWHEYTPRGVSQPDVPSYSYRDYGNRVGFWRMLEVMDQHKIRCCACMNSAVLEHCPEIRDAMVERDWAYMAHGIYNTRPISNYSIEEERAYWKDTLATVKKHTGKDMKGRLGRGGGNTVNTPDLMAEFGMTYHCDWTFDDQPFPMRVKNGAKFIHVPYSFQTHDGRQDRWNRDAAYLAQVIKDQFDVLYREGATNGTVMCVSLHPYWVGKAQRAKHLDDALSYVLKHPGVWNTTGDEIAEYYLKNHYDTMVAYLAQQKQKGLA